MSKCLTIFILMILCCEVQAKEWRDLAIYRALTGEGESCGKAPHCASAKNVIGTKLCRVDVENMGLSQNEQYDGSGWIKNLPVRAMVRFTGREVRDPELGLMISEVKVISTGDVGWVFAYRFDCAYEKEFGVAQIKRAPSGALRVAK